jgi:uncharacterized protein YmfQ (DUF2313 family)
VLLEEGVLERLDIVVSESQDLLGERSRALASAAGLHSKQVVEQGADEIVVQKARSSSNQEGKDWEVIVRLSGVCLAPDEDDVRMLLKA